MAVYRRKLANNKYTQTFNYDFKLNGQRYTGSTHKTVKREALEYEKNLKEQLANLRNEQVEKNKKESLIRFREKITAEIQGESLALEKTWDVFRMKAPSQMKRVPSPKVWTRKQTMWEDFYYFLKDRHPKCSTLRDVSPSIAQEYIAILKTTGKFNKSITHSRGTYQSKITQLADSTINDYIDLLKQLFRIMTKDGALLENPFQEIQKSSGKKKSRDVFPIHELEKIDKFIIDQKNNPALCVNDYFNNLINEAIYIIGINTGLRRADICLLKWEEIDFEERTINRELEKTHENVCIPMTLALYNFLKLQLNKKKNEFVTPELATMYKENDEGLSYRFKKMLKALDITCLKSYKGRSRKTSNKDIHSLRHSFCYIHGMLGTPLITVQSMVGHMDEKMTEAYMMHKTDELKKDAIEKFSLQPFHSLSSDPLREKKKRLIKHIEDCNVEEFIEKLQGYLLEMKNQNLEQTGHIKF